MSFWSNLSDALETKAVQPYVPGTRRLGMAGKTVPKDFGDGRTAIKEGYEACTWVYRCVLRKQNMISSVPWLVRGTEADGTISDDRDHLAARRLNNPASVYDRWYMMHRAAGFLSVAGNAFFGKAGEGADDEDPTRWLNSKTAEMRVESPVGVQPIEDGEGWIREYEVDGGKGDPWDPATVIHVMLPSLSGPFWGMSELQALAKSVDTDVLAHRWNLDSFGSGGMPPYLMVDYTVNPDDLTEARAAIEDRFRGKGRERTPWLIPGANIATGKEPFRAAIELHKLGMTAQELDWLGGAAFTRDEIYAGLGFHPADASNERATHDNARVAKRQAWEEAAIPLLDAFSSWFTLAMLTRPERESGLAVAPDLGGVRALQDSRDATATAFHDLTKGGLFVADAATYLGMDVEERAEYEEPQSQGGADRDADATP